MFFLQNVGDFQGTVSKIFSKLGLAKLQALGARLLSDSIVKWLVLIFFNARITVLIGNDFKLDQFQVELFEIKSHKTVFFE